MLWWLLWLFRTTRQISATTLVNCGSSFHHYLRRFKPLPLGGRHHDDEVRRLVDSLGLRRRRRRGKRGGRRLQPRPLLPAGSVPVVLEADRSDDVTTVCENQVIPAGLHNSELSSSSAFTQSSKLRIASCRLKLMMDMCRLNFARCWWWVTSKVN